MSQPPRNRNLPIRNTANISQSSLFQTRHYNSSTSLGIDSSKNIFQNCINTSSKSQDDNTFIHSNKSSNVLQNPLSLTTSSPFLQKFIKIRHSLLPTFKSQRHFDSNKTCEIRELRTQINLRHKRKNEQAQRIKCRKKSLESDGPELDEIKKTRLKFRHLLNKNQIKICRVYENRNKLFNEKALDHFKGDYYIHARLQHNAHFHYGKHQMGLSHDPYQHIVDVQSMRRSHVSSYEIFKMMSEKEKKMIKLDPTNFIKDSEFIRAIEGGTSIPLVTRICEEEKGKNKIKTCRAESAKNVMRKEVNGKVNSNVNGNHDANNQDNVNHNTNHKIKTTIHDLLLDINSHFNMSKYQTKQEALEMFVNEKVKRLRKEQQKIMKKRRIKHDNALIRNEVTKMENKIHHISKFPSSDEYYRKSMKSNKLIESVSMRDYLISMNRSRIKRKEELKGKKGKSKVFNRNDDDYFMNQNLQKVKESYLEMKAIKNEK